MLSNHFSIFFFPFLFLLVFLTTYSFWGNHPHRLKQPTDYAIPRTLWTYHAKDTPTPRQALCLATWRTHHPAPLWRIHVLTPSTAHGYLHGLPDLHYQAPLLRDPDRWEETVALHALTEHGGIWIHPHTYLREPLDKSLITNKKEIFAFSYRTDKDTRTVTVPALDKRLIASPPRNPFMENGKKEYMRLLAFPSVEAYVRSLPSELTLPAEWVLSLALQHSLLQHPYPMESIHLRSVEDGPIRHLYEARGDPKKAEAIALHPDATEPIVFL